MILCLTSVEHRMAKSLDVLCSLLNFREAVLSVLSDIDGAMHFLQGVQMLLNNIKVMLVVSLEVHRTGDCLES